MSSNKCQSISVPQFVHHDGKVSYSIEGYISNHLEYDPCVKVTWSGLKIKNVRTMLKQLIHQRFSVTLRS